MNAQPARSRSRDLYAVATVAVLVAAAVVVGHAIERADASLRVGWPPLYAKWEPHWGPGTPAAVLVAALVLAYGPPLADRLPRRALPLAGWAASAAWTFSLALVDGWHRGFAGRLTTKYEYLTVMDRFHDVPAALRGFTGHILLDAPDNWPPHVAGHPPGATLTFVALDRIGLGGGAWAAAWCVVTGASAVAAVLLALRWLAGEESARRAAPYLVLAPAAVWVGVSADGYFAAVAAWALALLAYAATRTGQAARLAALGTGLLSGWLCYLSYGLGLLALVGGAVLLVARTVRPLPFVVAGALVVPVVFGSLGFDWWEGYRLLVERYYQGAARVRPYGYWVWANLACTALVVGPACVAGLRRAPRAARDSGGRRAVGLLAAAALTAVLVADVSGMSKAETERIWLPFALWLLPATALLPDRARRPWLAAQAALALVLNHAFVTGW
ncbi:hypothetical protein [Streptomyces sp. NPDC048172]|uniref:hypothetical protein n=1 Tax=Streptomyces sp. NPDC048172 TaxID=3365505 RepID=UPI003720A6F3